jgi:hypothetical protein
MKRAIIVLFARFCARSFDARLPGAAIGLRSTRQVQRLALTSGVAFPCIASIVALFVVLLDAVAASMRRFACPTVSQLIFSTHVAATKEKAAE